MIISASRRTDIPTYYSDWFLNRIKEQFVLVRNPMNVHQVSKIHLGAAVVDCIVFWTKNPKPMLHKLDQLKEYNYYFQFSLNAYGKDIEKNVPSKNDEVIETFRKLSDKIGAERVLWRYDPILLNKKYTVAYHTYYFEQLANKLQGYTEKCTISYMDFYKSINNNIKSLEIAKIAIEDQRTLAENLCRIAFRYGLKMETCAEGIALEDLNIGHAKCIDDQLIQRIIGCDLEVEKDKNQRPTCGCIASIDIGAYETCLNGCKYCYANHRPDLVKKNTAHVDLLSPLLCSQLAPTDVVKERAVKSLKNPQISLLKREESDH